MKKYRMLIVIVSILIASLAYGIGSPAMDDSWPAYPGSPAGPSAFIRTDGEFLEKPNGKQFLIKGIAFGNHVWGNPSSSVWFTHHRAVDYKRVKSMGFNAIRFYINYGLFEDDDNPFHYKTDGFDWLDRNIAAARKNGVYLVLNMHYPQGGFQSNGEGDALWTNTDNQARLAALWKAIAERYRNEEIIIGYGLVNEPVPTKSVAQWTDLAQRIINEIRSVDQHHLLFVERVNWLKFTADPADRENLFFPRVTDPAPKNGIVYEYHMYCPLAFTHQNASWIPALKGKFAVYPDPSHIETEEEKWEWFSDTNPPARIGTTSWTTLNGVNFQASKPTYMIGKPVIQARSIGRNGSVMVDEIVVKEYDAADKFIRTIVTNPVDGDDGWHFWSRDGSGSMSMEADSGASGGKCLGMRGTTDDANATCDALKFIVTRNHKYKITGRVRGTGVSSDAIVRFRIDFYSCKSVYTWNKDYLGTVIGAYTEFSKENKIPVYLGEFGAIIDCFKPDRGGTRWLADMLDIIISRNVNYNYHAYHDSTFGLFMNNDNTFPDPDMMNKPVVDLFTKHQ
jgi:endoglucanase